MKTLFLIIIPLLSIDLFVIIYKSYKKLELKRINSHEKQIGFEEAEYTTLEKITKKRTGIIYAISTIISVIYLNFIDSTMFESTNFVDMLRTEFSYIFLIFTIYLTLVCIFKYIKAIIGFIIGFTKGMFPNKEDDDNSDN